MLSRVDPDPCVKQKGKPFLQNTRTSARDLMGKFSKMWGSSPALIQAFDKTTLAAVCNSWDGGRNASNSEMDDGLSSASTTMRDDSLHSVQEEVVPDQTWECGEHT
jgi:hypothetical protein